MIDRRLVDTLRKRLAEPAPLIQVLLGPRQVGKTTALKAVLSESDFYQSADLPIVLHSDSIDSWWKQAKEKKCQVFAIDEVQKIPDWSEALKRLWDREQPFKVIVTDSSSLLLEKGLKETMAGRFEVIRAEHWNYSEAQSVFQVDLEAFIEFGCYPGSMRFLDDLPRWGEYVRDSIIEPALGRDLLQLHPIDNPALLRQIFGVAISLPAQVVSLEKLQSRIQSKGTKPTISHYLSLLGGSFMVSGVEKYYARSFKSRKSSPKLVVHDNALLRAFHKPISAPISPDEKGRFFENAIAARFIEAGWDVFYWNDRDKEVDLVVLGPEGQKYAIEVKLGKTSSTDLNGLLAFVRKYRDFEPCLISGIDQEIEGFNALDKREMLSLTRQ